ncbi:hypothetical protein [Rosenbergiella collisarenosi]|uniref:hypothetical protein n=1 Tax=Rosenbergiella collisarenosi TaxID=1544695 RepID=UPI001F4EEFBB|nr:hypothetical protein [Rosenbergiella collisarenosi]
MTRHCFIIRHAGQSERLALLLPQFRQLTAADYYVFEERFTDPQSVTQRISPEHWQVGRDYLSDHQLYAVKHTGWQCGDYIAYAARDLLPEYDYYWIMDDDIAINMPLDVFIRRTAELTQECLACEFSPRDESWMWFSSVANLLSQEVYGMLYCLVRLSGSAIDQMKAHRSKMLPQGAGRLDYPNDEAFTGTLLMHLGVSCADLKKVLPELFQPYFTLTRPVLLAELAAEHTQGKVLHPICDTTRCWQKIATRVKQQQFSSLRDRLYTCYLNLPEDILDQYFDQRFLTLLSQAFDRQPLLNFSRMIIDFPAQKFPTFSRYWFYRSYILVVELESEWGRYAIDIQADHKVFMIPRNKKARQRLKQSIFGSEGKQELYRHDQWLFPQLTTSLFCEDQDFSLASLSTLIEKIDTLIIGPSLEDSTCVD